MLCGSWPVRIMANAYGACDDTGAGWQLLLQREVPGSLHFTSWCRTLPCGGTEYLSRTIGAEASAHEVLDLYLDDGFRPRWVWSGRDGSCWHRLPPAEGGDAGL
jgi:hypothetical protein